jgi:hypothetical protein
MHQVDTSAHFQAFVVAGGKLVGRIGKAEQVAAGADDTAVGAEPTLAVDRRRGPGRHCHRRSLMTPADALCCFSHI